MTTGGADERVATTGTVTFLFSDIEGSTTLEQRVGTSRYGELRERHRTILRAAFEANDGVEQGTEGDSFFVVFRSARAAVAAAVSAQRGLASEPWPTDGAVRVRIGLNSGEAELAGGSYVGLEINRAARIAAAAHGGQILASDTTRALVARDLPPDVSLRDLGEFRLRDLLSPERIVQIDADGLPSAFSPPRTLDVRPNSLPSQLTTFIGRQEELDQAQLLLANTRLLTLTGPGGTGKTRLSIQLASLVADGFPDGVHFIPLEPIRDPMLVAAKVASTVGIVEGGTRPVIDTLVEWLSGRRLLLVLDNFEQVIEAAPTIADFLRVAPGLKVIATSRAPLRISGEQEYPVPGLPTPPDPSSLTGLERMSLPGSERGLDAETIGHYASVRLFIDRAVAVRPGFVVTNENAPAVAGISARLQGMPLAIELAAARIKLLSPDAILARLEHQLDVLAAGGRDLPPRQQTLRGAIAWSYDLLDDPGRRLLDRLSVFMGGCDVATAEAVCGPAADVGGDVADGLLSLADQSLVRVDEAPDGEPRFRLLDTIRAYASERLAERSETETIQARHRDWYLALAEQAAAELAGADQRRWLERLELEHDDIRAVLDRAMARPDPDVAIRLGFAMWRFWQKHGHLGEARRRLEAMSAEPWSKDDPRRRARIAEALGGVCWWQGDIVAMTIHYEEALALWLEIGDEREIANAYYNAAFIYAIQRGPDGIAPGQPDEDDDIGVEYIQQSLERYRRIGDERGEANALWALGNRRYFHSQGDLGVGRFREALAIFRRTGDLTMEAWSLHMLGTGLMRQGEVAEAREVIEHATRHFYAAGDAAGLTLTFDDMSALAVLAGDLVRAARMRGAARNLSAETGTGLAGYVEEVFDEGLRPTIRSQMPPEEVERYGAEGAAMTLDEAVAYALEGSDGPIVEGHAQATTASRA
jgi:predicted ATPase/class 3 adenylate cyclase